MGGSIEDKHEWRRRLTADESLREHECGETEDEALALRLLVQSVAVDLKYEPLRPLCWSSQRSGPRGTLSSAVASCFAATAELPRGSPHAALLLLPAIDALRASLLHMRDLIPGAALVKWADGGERKTRRISSVLKHSRRCEPPSQRRASRSPAPGLRLGTRYKQWTRRDPPHGAPPVLCHKREDCCVTHG